MSSVSEYPTPTSPRSSSHYSFFGGGHGAQLLQRLEEGMSRNSRTSFLSSVDDPPRKLILSSPVLPVVSSNTINGPLSRMSLHCETCVLVLNVERTKQSYNLMPRSSLVKTFVQQFAKDSDQAVAALSTKTSVRDDPGSLLRQLLFRSVELDRTKLGNTSLPPQGIGRMSGGHVRYLPTG
jgi:serine/arginine repetitive matrix protein 2